jgi:hypothetical protein
VPFLRALKSGINNSLRLFSQGGSVSIDHMRGRGDAQNNDGQQKHLKFSHRFSFDYLNSTDGRMVVGLNVTRYWYTPTLASSICSEK